MSYSTRYQQLRDQLAYQRAAQAGGLTALLAPYHGARLLPAPPVEQSKVPTRCRRVLRQAVGA